MISQPLLEKTFWVLAMEGAPATGRALAKEDAPATGITVKREGSEGWVGFTFNMLVFIDSIIYQWHCIFLMWCGPSWGLAGDAVPAPRTPPELLSRLRTLVRLFFLLCPLKTHKHWFLVYFNGFVSKTDMPSLGCGFPGIYVQQGLDSTSNTTSNTPVGTLPSPVDFPVCLTSQSGMATSRLRDRENAGSSEASVVPEQFAWAGQGHSPTDFVNDVATSESCMWVWTKCCTVSTWISFWSALTASVLKLPGLPNLHQPGTWRSKTFMQLTHTYSAFTQCQPLVW